MINLLQSKKNKYDWGKFKDHSPYLSKFDQSLIPEEATPEGMDENTSELLKTDIWY
ncbi:hypothetical protein MASR2M39_30330 [Ignavibacteriales bacterium]